MKSCLEAYEELAQECDRLKAELRNEKLNLEALVADFRKVKEQCDQLSSELAMMRTWASNGEPSASQMEMVKTFALMTHDEMKHQTKLAMEARGERDAAQAALQIHDLALRDEIKECWKVLNFLYRALGNDGVKTDNALSALARATALDAYRELKRKLK